VAGNPKVDKLRSRGVIEVETLGEPAGKADPEDPGDSDAAGGAAAPARGSRKRTEPTS